MKYRRSLARTAGLHSDRRIERGATGALILAIGLAFALAGCRTANFQASNLPDELRVPPAEHTSDLDLARMAGPGFGTSQLGPGDLVEVTIASGRGDEKADAERVRVSLDGQLAVPMVGLVPVIGLEPFEAEQRITTAAVERNVFRQPSVTLQVVEQAVNRVTVLGAVKTPGVHALPRGSSDLVNALAAAGGLTEEAGTQVDVLRQDALGIGTARGRVPNSLPSSGVALASYESSSPWPAKGAGQMPNPNSTPAPQTVRIDLAQTQPGGGANYGLGDRDVVMVLPEEKRLIHVTGLVHKADQFEMPRDQDVRVLDAIAMAGGTDSLFADKVFVIRKLPNMLEPVVIKVSIAEAKRSGNENLRLAPGDLVTVEPTMMTTMTDGFTKAFHIGIGLGSNLFL